MKIVTLLESPLASSMRVMRILMRGLWPYLDMLVPYGVEPSLSPALTMHMLMHDLRSFIDDGCGFALSAGQATNPPGPPASRGLAGAPLITCNLNTLHSVPEGSAVLGTGAGSTGGGALPPVPVLGGQNRSGGVEALSGSGLAQASAFARSRELSFAYQAGQVRMGGRAGWVHNSVFCLAASAD